MLFTILKYMNIKYNMVSINSRSFALDFPKRPRNGNSIPRL